MKVKLWEDERTYFEVEVLEWNPPQRERIRVDQLGEPSSYVPGRVIPGNIRIVVPINFHLDKNYTIEVDNQRMRLEITDLYNSKGRNIAEGFVH